MEKGNFYFVKDEYFEFVNDPHIMKNSEIIDGELHNRACYYSFVDKDTNLHWFIPISSKLEKYKELYNKKILKYGKVDTIVFGFVLGKEKAFLIQNMFPITTKYILNEYINEAIHKPVSIKEDLMNEIYSKAKYVLSMQRRGIKVIFPDVIRIEKLLIDDAIK